MRLLSGISWAIALSAVRTVATDASIYLSEPSSGVSKQALSPATSRLLLARRLGLSQFHSLEGADDATLKILNDYGGEQKALLSTDEPWTGPQRNLIIVEGVDNPDGILRLEAHRPAFTIPNPPNFSHTLQLVKDLISQAQNSPAGEQSSCSYSLENGGKVHGGIVYGPPQAAGYCPKGTASAQDWSLILDDIASATPGRSAILHISLPDPVSGKKDPEASNKELSQQMSRLLRPGSGHESTVILMPASTQKTKRTSTSPYGRYAMPNSKPLQARGAQSEAPLTAPSAPQTSLASHRHSTPQALKASSAPKSPGILPVCQPSIDKLNEATNNCSGHGTPYLKLKSTSDSSPDCYACRCQKTVIDRGEGTKTIEWAGPACSKKDVSQPFWLLAGITIGLVATASWGVGLLFSIGQEDLPSVIGAGVAGPRAQK